MAKIKLATDEQVSDPVSDPVSELVSESEQETHPVTEPETESLVTKINVALKKDEKETTSDNGSYIALVLLALVAVGYAVYNYYQSKDED